MQATINHLFVTAVFTHAHGRRPRSMTSDSFAVQALLRWFQAGDDVQSSLPKLALFYGPCVDRIDRRITCIGLRRCALRPAPGSKSTSANL